jgi:hypothetical protein
VELDPGLYEARFEAGSSVREQVIFLEPGKDPMEVTQDQIAFASAAPLEHTRDQFPKQSDAAARLSRKVHRKIGAGGQLLIFVRDDDLRGRSNPSRGLAIHDADGTRVGEIEADGKSGGGSGGAHPPWAGCTYQLTPGSWRLRCPAPGGQVEQSIVVCAEWQTQVFMQRRRLQSGGSRWPELADASVLMAKADKGFEPKLAELRATELARQGLRDRRIVITASDINAMLYDKTRNPMLAIYGAHLMIQVEDPDRAFLAKVVRRLRELVGDHPDVMALLLWLDPEADVGDFSVPPMLSSSWTIVVAATAERPELVPRGSLSAAISEHVLAGGPWLRWRHATETDEVTVPEQADQALDLGAAMANLATLLITEKLSPREPIANVSPAECDVISFATQAGVRVSGASDTDVLERLGYPRSVAEDAINSAIERLGSKDSAGLGSQRL